MQRSLARYSALVTLAAVAGLSSGRPVSATARERALAVVYPLPSVSIATTHLPQVNIANVSYADTDSSRTELVVRGRLLDAHGVELARSESQTLPRGATFSWKITRAELAGAPGDERGRIQVRAELDIVGTLRVGAFVPSLELVNEATGEHGPRRGELNDPCKLDRVGHPSRRIA